MSELIKAVRAHAQTNYAKGGWDILVECWEDKDIQEVLDTTNATTETKAIREVGYVLKTLKDYGDDIRATAW